MHVVATAGHVDHGKSTLVRALTGTDPDRLEEEHARGLSIELGYAWTGLPGAGDVAFVDVPGHERFVTTMLSGIGPVPAALLVVAADDPWMPQAAEHLAALDALGVAHGVVAITRADLADPAAMAARARAEVDATSLAGAPVVAVSAVTGLGLDSLRDHLVALLTGLPAPDPASDVRLWVDRCFHVRGAGTVVTGTLPAGTVRPGDNLEVGGGTVRVRGVQSLGRPVDAAVGVARVALNVAGEERDRLDRHSVLVTPGAFHHTEVLDVRLSGTAEGLPRRPLLHVGSVAVPAYVRPLGDRADGLARLTLERPLPLRVGDRALLRDPGSRRVWGLTVLDPAPPTLRRRGAARDRAEALRTVTGGPDGAEEVRRRGLVHRDLLRRLGVPVPEGATADGWLVADAFVDHLADRVRDLVVTHDGQERVEPGLTLGAVAERLGVPSPQVVAAVVRPPLRLAAGRVTARSEQGPKLSPALAAALAAIEADLAEEPFQAPTAHRLAELRVDARAVTAATRAGRLLHLGEGIVLLPGSDVLATRLLAELPQPFTTSQARERLGTSRRVVLPLLGLLDRQGRTRRNADDTRSVVTPGTPPPGR